MDLDMGQFKADLRVGALDMGAVAFGVADVDALKQRVPDLLSAVPGDYCRAIVMGVRLQGAVLGGITDRPTPLYFHNYRQVNYQLDRIGFYVADEVQSAGFEALAIPASQIIKKKPMSGHVSHKLLGWAAGIGHIGLNTLLIHPEFGAQLRYVSVLTDMELESDRPHDGDCGDCKACVSVCPANAISESRDDFNLGACYDKLTEFTRIPYVGQHICGVCVKACRGLGHG